MLFDRQDERLGFGQPSQLHATAGFAGDAGISISLLFWQSPMPHYAASHMNSIALASLLIRARKMPVTADPVCATRNRCTAIKKRDKPPCFTPRPINHEERPDGDLRYLHQVQREKKRREWRCS
jgi:hypothetical protein